MSKPRNRPPVADQPAEEFDDAILPEEGTDIEVEMLPKGWKITEPGAAINVPLAPIPEGCYLSNDVDLNLSPKHTRALHSILQGLRAKYPKPPGYSKDLGAADVVRFMLDQVTPIES